MISGDLDGFSIDFLAFLEGVFGMCNMLDT